MPERFFDNPIVSERGKNVIVSASAGCGKTTNMIWRIAGLVSRDKVDLSSMLIITFTRASARDMKDKLAVQLKKLPDDPFVKRQLSAIERADISTIDSFCTRLLRDYFTEAGVDPSFSVLDEDEAQLLKLRALDKVTSARQMQADDDFIKLSLALSGNRNTAALNLAVLNVYDLAVNCIDPEGFIRDTLATPYSLPLSQNRMYLLAFEQIREQLLHFLQSFKSLLPRLDSLGLGKHITLAQTVCDAINSLLLSGDIVQLSQKPQNRLPNTPQLNKEQKTCGDCALLHAEFKELKSEFTSALKAIRTAYPPYSYAELEELVLSTGVLARTLSELVLDFAKEYAEEKQKRAAVDFSDLCHLSLKVLSNPDTARAIKSRYRYIFVDECQDLNQVNDALVSLIKGGDNLFAVGDIKQCIYRFRGAQPELFHQKSSNARTDPNSRLFRLGTNYRSNRGVLNFVNFVFSKLMVKEFSLSDYSGEDMLEGASDAQLSAGKPVELHIVTRNEYDAAAIPVDSGASGTDGSFREDGNDDGGADEADGGSPEEISMAQAEGAAVCGAITQLVSEAYMPAQADGQPARKVRYSDIAVIVRGKNSAVRTIYAEIKAANIPVYAEFDGTLRDFKEIAMLINLLKITDNLRQDIPLAAVLRSIFGGFSDGELCEIRRGGTHKFFHEAFLQYAQSGADSELSKKCAQFCGKLARYRTLSAGLTAGELISQIIKDFDYHAYVLARSGGSERAAALTAFVLGLEGKSYARTLFDFLQYCAQMGGSLRISSAPFDSTDCVRLTTMHKSKGLEYPVVILCGLGSKFNMFSRSSMLLSRDYGAGLCAYDFALRQKLPLFTFHAMRKELADMQIKEEINVLYVAMTRAKYKLILTAACDENKAKTIDSVHDIKGMRNYIYPLLGILKSYTGSDLEIRRIPPAAAAAKPAPATLTDRRNDFTGEVSAALGRPYPHSDALGVVLKRTVTELNRSHPQFDGMAPQPIGEWHQPESFPVPPLLQTMQSAGRQLEQFADAAATVLSEYKTHKIADTGTKGADGHGGTYGKLYAHGFAIENDTEQSTHGKADSGAAQSSGTVSGLSAWETGDAYHKFIELINLDCDSIAELEREMHRLTGAGRLTEAEAAAVDLAGVLAFLRDARGFFRGKVYREKGFLLYVPGTELGLKTAEKILVQGKIDFLVIDGNSAVIIDYKHSSLSSSALAERYRKQLELYAYAAETVLGVKVTHRFIYSFAGKRLISV